MMSESQNSNRQWVVDDLTKVEAMAKELETYIVAGEVYRTLLMTTAGSNRKITMSGGDLLARLKRLREQRSTLAAAQQARVDEVASSVQGTIYALRTRFHDLLRRELKARSDQLAWNVDIRRDREEKEADPAELHNRQQIAAIKEELSQA